MPTIISTWRAFASEHDELPAFHAVYFVATLLAATLFHLGFFAILIAAHMCLDFVKYHDGHRRTLRQTFKGILLESLPDIALFLIALTFAVYVNHTFFLASLSGIVRSEYTILRVIGTVSPRVRIVQRFFGMISNMCVYLHEQHPGMTLPISRMQRVSIALIIACLLLLAWAVFLYRSRIEDLVTILSYELRIRL